MCVLLAEDLDHLLFQFDIYDRQDLHEKYIDITCKHKQPTINPRSMGHHSYLKMYCIVATE